MNRYDAIVIGARCGGAPLAMLLARQGHNVLLVDRSPLGSDIMSTHYVKRTGAALLDEWGLLDQLVSAGTPQIRRQVFDLDGIKLSGRAPAAGGVDFDVTPRRFYLDRILQDAAIEAGVEVRDNFRVTELLFDDDRVTGIKGTHKGESYTEHARLVVGADGLNSMVARAVEAPMVVDAGIHTCGHYAYYSGIESPGDLAELFISTEERRFYITFPTNDDLQMVFLFWPSEMARSVRSNLDVAFQDSLALVPDLAGKVAGGTRESRIVGTHHLPNFFRRARGNGWALVGDAALHRDPITAQGITNAFMHASILAQELHSAFIGDKSIDAALADYDRQQFARLKPMFDYTVHLSRLQPVAPELAEMLPSIIGNDDAIGAFIGAFMGSVPLNAVFPPALINRFAADVHQAELEVRDVA